MLIVKSFERSFSVMSLTCIFYASLHCHGSLKIKKLKQITKQYYIFSKHYNSSIRFSHLVTCEDAMEIHDSGKYTF